MRSLFEPCVGAIPGEWRHEDARTSLIRPFALGLGLSEHHDLLAERAVVLHVVVRLSDLFQ